MVKTTFINSIFIIIVVIEAVCNYWIHLLN